jgi:hypothetical protein
MTALRRAARAVNAWRRTPDGRAWIWILGVRLALVAWCLVLFERSHGRSLLGFLFRWDSVRYLSLARFGYVSAGPGADNIAFFPLFPWLVRGAAAVAGDVRVSALLVAQAASIAGLFLFYKVAEIEVGPAPARRCLIALMLFPAAHFFAVPYSEGLYLLLCAGAFLSARRGDFATAGLVGFLAALTRTTGVLLLPALAVEFWQQRRETPRPWSQAAPLLLIPLGYVVYLGINHHAQGSFFAFQQHLERKWHKSFCPPWTSIAGSLHGLAHPQSAGYLRAVTLPELTAAVFFVVGTFLALARLRASYAVFLGASAFLCLSTEFLLSTPRYLLTAFPFFFLFADGSSRRSFFVWSAVSTALLLYWSSRFVHGSWAF